MAGASQRIVTLIIRQEKNDIGFVPRPEETAQ